jgi:tight adherence protein C
MPLHLPLVLTAVFITVAIVSGSLASVVLSRSPVRQRLRKLTAQPDHPRAFPLTDAPDPVFRRLSTALPKSGERLSSLRRRLSIAGYDSLNAAVIYSVSRLVFPIVLAIVPLLVLDPKLGMLVSLPGIVVGYIFPAAFIRRRIALRKRAIEMGLPDALDLLVVCLEAGSSLDQAILKTSNELEFAMPAIARELRTISVEIRAGKQRLEAFHNFAVRTDTDDVRALVTTLVQTDRFGTSIAQALRTHADTSRTRRRQGAEERASKIGVKLVFPLALFLMPAVFVVCVGPVVVRIYRAFF